MAKKKRAPAKKPTAAKAPPTSNWEKLKATLTGGKKPRGSKHAATDLAKAVRAAKAAAPAPAPTVLGPGTHVALDCEMVGVGAHGRESVLARCSLVDERGAVVYDKHVRVDERVTDFRTKYSGVRARDLKAGDAVSFRECQKAVAALLENKVLVGHALSNDLAVLLLDHPRARTRDTARWSPLMRTNRGGKKRPRKLRDLVREHLGRSIQEGEHGSVEDATAAMDLYRKFATDWEASLRQPAA
mmetsp:Transcript_22811/g.71513  ORF Transcript_22811/g.71513 Transcript_22811/m.71513 type:complete len:243 (+) Transcript_22811:1403-2131(+)